ncbi:hypothetical protein MBAV_003351 [Candidatus Magnetobacterium bavaricum]|uniref:Uncharacterized protein n=1 Tax=Candidatus Magnetobacterium bavaricum TaxID=29290 RepID=A0A0F3GR77_9BACT|nr:hypothetical protein MBAV_003351 [Candidatus Magnetobacterium bavaricum]
MHVMKEFGTYNHTDEISKETIGDAIKLVKFYAGQVVHIINVYAKKKETPLTEIEKQVIETLQQLKGEVKKDMWRVSVVTEAVNEKLPVHAQTNTTKISLTLKRIGLETKKTSGNKAALVWDSSKIEKLQQKLALLAHEKPRGNYVDAQHKPVDNEKLAVSPLERRNCATKSVANLQQKVDFKKSSQQGLTANFNGKTGVNAAPELNKTELAFELALEARDNFLPSGCVGLDRCTYGRDHEVSQDGNLNWLKLCNHTGEACPL